MAESHSPLLPLYKEALYPEELEYQYLFISIQETTAPNKIIQGRGAALPHLWHQEWSSGGQEP